MKAIYIGLGLALVISMPCLSQDNAELRKLENVVGTVQGSEARIAFVQCFKDRVICFAAYENEAGARMYSDFECPDIRCFDSEQDITYAEFKRHREVHREYRPHMVPDKENTTHPEYE